jgi:hypothetical protein
MSLMAIEPRKLQDPRAKDPDEASGRWVSVKAFGTDALDRDPFFEVAERPEAVSRRGA